MIVAGTADSSNALELCRKSLIDEPLQLEELSRFWKLYKKVASIDSRCWVCGETIAVHIPRKELAYCAGCRRSSGNTSYYGSVKPDPTWWLDNAWDNIIKEYENLP